jgi:signal transduction histidine kinase
MRRSLRSSLIWASVLWTAGLLALMHLLSLTVLHAFPKMRGGRSVAAVIMGLGLMGAGLWKLRQSLIPFRRLRDRLTTVRRGQERRVEGAYPTEVQPLIDDLNALIENRDRAVKRAMATAGDLAHGLKTPLALLAQEADRAAAAGNPELADSISQQVERMSRQINYHLARARASAFGISGAPPCSVAFCAEALVRTVSKLYAERALRISLRIPRDLRAQIHREDLEEILGNLLDNACKWATSQMSVEASRSDSAVLLQVDDDGPGLAPCLRTAVLERGVRIDETAPGSGLGLAIVRDLAELYHGSICLDESPLGGLRVRVSLPALEGPNFAQGRSEKKSLK